MSMTTKHTSGPIAICGLDPHELLIEPTEGRTRFIIKLPRGTGDEAIEQVANAEHLVACWNACDGINPEAVREMYEVLEDLMKIRGECFIPNDNDWWDNKANAALAKARGEA
jgi:hypothetical protein